MSTAQSSSGFAADAPRYGAEPVAAYYQLNQTGQPTPVESVNGLVGQVVVQLNGTPIVPSGQNINIVAGSGVVGISAGGNTSTGTVPLASADGSVVLTNAGGVDAAGSINFKSVIPESRATAVNRNVTGTNPYLIIGGPGSVDATRVAVFDVTGLTVGKQYLMSFTVYFGVYPAWTAAGATIEEAIFLCTNTGTNLEPLLSPSSSGFGPGLPILTWASLGIDVPAASYNTISVFKSAVVVAQSTGLQITVNRTGVTTGSLLTIDSGSLQLVALN